jgi:hypothetical protein
MSDTDDYQDKDERLNRLQEFAGTNEGPSRRALIESGATNLLPSGLLPILARAEIDSAVTTARNFPRAIKQAAQNIREMATLDDITAAEMMYALPRGNKPITGPSIRLAEIIAQCWGNNRVGAQVIEVDRVNKFIVAEGVFHDLETNAAVKATVQRRIVDKRGRIYSDDMIVTTGNAACSIARRNAILAGVPKAIWRRAYDEAQQITAGDVQTLAVRRGNALKAFAQFGVKPEQIFSALEVKTIEEITREHIPVLIGMYETLKTGESTVESMFERHEHVDMETGEVTNAAPRSNAKPNKPTSLDEFAAGSDDRGRAEDDEIAGETSSSGGAQVGDPPREGQPKMGPGEDDGKVPTPTNENEYIVYFDFWFVRKSATDVAIWYASKAEKQLRNVCKISEQTRDALKARIDMKAAGK